MSRPLRIAISNIQNGIGTTRGYWHYALTAWKYWLPHGSGPVREAARFVAEESVDLVALVEVGGGARRTRGVDQAALVAGESGLAHAAFFPAYVVGGRVNQGNAVCSRFPIEHVANHPLPGTGEPRVLSEAAVLVDGVYIRVFVTHLSLQRPLREPQIAAIVETLGPCDRPTILAGDFNIAAEDELELLAESPLQRVASAPTFPAWKPSKPLDHLFFSRHFHVRRGYAFDAFTFADHLPLVADVVLEG